MKSLNQIAKIGAFSNGSLDGTPPQQSPLKMYIHKEMIIGMFGYKNTHTQTNRFNMHRKTVVALLNSSEMRKKNCLQIISCICECDYVYESVQSHLKDSWPIAAMCVHVCFQRNPRQTDWASNSSSNKSIPNQSKRIHYYITMATNKREME